MGSETDRKIAEFQANAGIEPATGKRCESLQAMSKLGYELIRLIELEQCGIRGGDGYWHGCDPLWHVVNDIHELYGELHKPSKAAQELRGADPGAPPF